MNPLKLLTGLVGSMKKTKTSYAFVNSEFNRLVEETYIVLALLAMRPLYKSDVALGLNGAAVRIALTDDTGGYGNGLFVSFFEIIEKREKPYVIYWNMHGSNKMTGFSSVASAKAYVNECLCNIGSV